MANAASNNQLYTAGEKWCILNFEGGLCLWCVKAESQTPNPFDFSILFTRLGADCIAINLLSTTWSNGGPTVVKLTSAGCSSNSQAFEFWVEFWAFSYSCSSIVIFNFNFILSHFTQYFTIGRCLGQCPPLMKRMGFWITFGTCILNHGRQGQGIFR